MGASQPLEATTRQFFEQRYGSDFSQVRVHTDAPAARAAQSVGAQAFTVGSDIVFNQDRYKPGTTVGNELLAHELAHVVQQNAASTPALVRRRVLPELEQSCLDPSAVAKFSPEQLVAAVRELGDAVVGVRPGTPAYAALWENYATLSAEVSKRSTALQSRARPQGQRSLPEILLDWKRDGLLDPPYRPPWVAPFPPLTIMPEQARALGVPPLLAGAALSTAARPLAQAAAAGEEVAAAQQAARPALTLLQGGAGTGGAAAETAAAGEGLEVLGVAEGSSLAVVVPVLVGLVVLLWPSSTAEPFHDTLNPLTGGPWTRPDYDWYSKLTGPQIQYLDRLREAPFLPIDFEDDVEAAAEPVPAPKPKVDEQERSCLGQNVTRRGGHQEHDAYATQVTGSTFDWHEQTPELLAINYDGRTNDSTLVWEVKVGHGFLFGPNKSLNNLVLARMDAQRALGLAVAVRCGLLHLWSCKDRYVAALLNQRWNGVPPVLSR